MQHKTARDIPFINKGLLDALVHLPLPLQVSFIRQHSKIAQAELAKRVNMRQAQLSKLEKIGSDHLLSHYEKIAKVMGCRLVILPRNVVISPPRRAGKI